MNLWIRSQDRENLVQVNRIFITKYNDYEIVCEMPFENDGVLTLGAYKTEERALEVLDEIQNLLVIPSRNNLTYELADLNLKCYMISKVYEMPKE